MPLARTNLPEFGLRWHTDNALRGATVNPWNPALTPGGSSGGEAVATQQPFAVGMDVTDMDGLGDFVRALRLVVTANLLGLPARSRPWAWMKRTACPKASKSSAASTGTTSAWTRPRPLNGNWVWSRLSTRACKPNLQEAA